MLEVRSLSKSFGGLRAVDAVGFDVPACSITALIGPNGAGKTTIFAMIAGFIPPDAGSVRFAGSDITGLASRPDRGFRHGAHLPDRPAFRRPVGDARTSASARSCAPPMRAPAEAAARALGTGMGLDAFLDRPAAALTVAGRKRLELARALATGPSLLLLDEVMAGLNPSEINDIVELIRAVRADGVTILLIEHIMQAVAALAEQVHVLAEGRLIASGTPRAIAADARVIEAYLGRGAAERMARHA